jgi:hypothetical protein
LQSFGGGTEAGAVKQGWSDVDTGDNGSAAGGRERGVSGSGSDVEHAVAGEDRN